MKPYEALVKVTDNINESLTEEKKKTALWKKGDVVVVKEKGWKWGRNELKEFMIVTLPEDWTPEECQSLCCHHLVEGEHTDSNGITTIKQELICRSRYSLDIDTVLERCCEEKTDLIGVELENLKKVATSRMEDLTDHYQPLREYRIREADIEDKNDHSEIRELVKKKKDRLYSEMCTNVCERTSEHLSHKRFRKAFALSQKEAKEIKLTR